MRTHSRARAVLGSLAVVFVAACSRGSTAPSSAAPGARSATPSATAVAPAATSPKPAVAGSPQKAWLLVGRRGEPDLHLVLTTTGEIDSMAVPEGAPAPNWQTVVTATIEGDSTIVRDVVVQPGFGGREIRIDGQWHLPMVGLDSIPAGRSLDGSTIALVGGSYDPAAASSRFAIVDHAGADAVLTTGDPPLHLVRIITLSGAFEYDTMSPDGQILYVVQHLDGQAGGHYQVRAVDVATGVMRDAIIVDKTHPDEAMAGSPVAQLRRPGGLVLTLYRGPEHPFIHALASSEAWAVCIDLPAGDGDAAAGLDWGLAPSADGASVYAANARLGLVVEIDPNGLAVRRSASIGTTAAASIVLAKFGHGEVGSIGRRLIAAPDGALLFAAGANGITAIRTRDLSTERHDLAGSAIDGLGITPNGATLFALGRDGRIVALDAASGRVLGTVPGGGVDRLLAVAPW